ncbi:MAG: hypothetical protein NVV66_18490 [Cellulomonas sp.]|uniref:hypothetical protein n=1 Tax=Cellulomonas sp. TaxID=40001 RepID=UPI00258850C5|nr:hypothetical protein [Cellulomonas sp.]MCR6706587.1 hypothetical protein [Cellulomonas sp.]
MSTDTKPVEPKVLLVVGPDGTWSIEGPCSDFTRAAVLRDIAHQLDARRAGHPTATPPTTQNGSTS